MKDSWSVYYTSLKTPANNSGQRRERVTPPAAVCGAIEMPSHNGGAGGAGAPEQGAEVHAVAAEGLTDVFPPLQFPDQTPIWDGVVPDG